MTTSSETIKSPKKISPKNISQENSKTGIQKAIHHSLNSQKLKEILITLNSTVKSYLMSMKSSMKNSPKKPCSKWKSSIN